MDSDEAALIDLLSTPPPFAVLDKALDGPFFTVEGGPLPVAVQVGRIDTGQLVCTGVLIGWGEQPVRVTAAALRAVRLGELVERVRAGVAAETPDAPLVARQRGRRGWPDSHYRMVVQAYRRALVEAPGRHVQAMAAELHASVPTVHRWLGRARDKGMLERSGRRGAR